MTSKYGTEIMTSEECLLYMETALENGVDINTAIQDMRMLDTIFQAERSHLLSFGFIKKTRSGNYRKNSLLSDTINTIINARVNDIIF